MGDIELHSEIGNMRVWFISECSSTFDMLRKLPSEKSKFNAVFTYNQTAGKGQFNRQWKSQPYKNIALSLLVPVFDNVMFNPTLFNMCLSLAARDALQRYTKVALHIKWPNDIYAGNMKIAGFLMSIVSINNEKHFQMGLGINVNQKTWTASVPNACSFRTLNGKEENLDKILKSTLHQIKESLDSYDHKKGEEVLARFNKALWKLKKAIIFSDDKGARRTGILHGVNEKGQIIIEEGASQRSFHLGQVRLLLG